MVDFNHVHRHGSFYSSLLKFEDPTRRLVMGISYNGGKLPFVVFLDDKQFEDEINDLYVDHENEWRKLHGNTKEFNKAEFPYDNEWLITHDGPVIDGIYMSVTFRRGRTKVFCGWLGDGDDFFLVAKTEAALKKFLQEFGYKEELTQISKNEKVVQLS
jgi:hypothetical protein